MWDYTATSDDYGIYTVTTGLLPGVFDWRLKNSQTLANGGILTLLADDTNVDMGSLKEGDANNDNTISIVDFNTLKLTYGKGPQDPGYDARADFTGDNVVNISDFNLLKVNYGQAGYPAFATPTPTRTSTPTNTATPVSAVDLIAHMTISGRTAPPSPRQSVPVTVELRLLTGGPLLSYSGTTDDYGFITVTGGLIPGPGTYNWRIKNPQTLANSGSASLVSGQNQVDMGLLKEGDANNDNTISVVDFNIVKVTYGKGPQDPGYDARADFTGDNVINVQDFNLLKLNYGQGGAVPISPFGTGSESAIRNRGGPEISSKLNLEVISLLLGRPDYGHMSGHINRS